MIVLDGQTLAEITRITGVYDTDRQVQRLQHDARYLLSQVGFRTGRTPHTAGASGTRGLL